MRMLKNIALTLALALFAHGAARASCHIPNLIRCIDSACVAGISGDASIRCALCGDARAENNRPIRSIRAGALTLDPSDGPTNPQMRFAWAGTECLRLLPDCTARDIAQNYYSLIENACRAAADNLGRANRAPTAGLTDAECERGLVTCMTERCERDWSACTEQGDFDRHWSTCLLNVRCPGTTDTASMRGQLNDIRQRFANDTAAEITRIVQDAEYTRNNRIRITRADCESGGIMDLCIARACTMLPNGCVDNDRELRAARNICGYTEIACRQLR